MTKSIKIMLKILSISLVLLTILTLYNGFKYKWIYSLLGAENVSINAVGSGRNQAQKTKGQPKKIVPNGSVVEKPKLIWSWNTENFGPQYVQVIQVPYGTNP